MTSKSLPEQQSRYLDEFIPAYLERTRSSHARRRAAWPSLADPRSSSGFARDAPEAMRSFWLATKQIRYPLVGARCRGSRVWDVDGNEYIDFGLGFGANLFGHRPEFLVNAMHRRIELGMPMGFQSEVANEVAHRIARLVHAERVAFSNTGTEAVMGALRMARATTGKSKIVVFANSYHGSYDAVMPAISFNHGLPPSHLVETLVLDYGADSALAAIAESADDIAAVLVEPVQARQPHLQPRQFLHELRALTCERDIALIFDDVLLGFRIHQAGCQAYFEVEADLAVFGKIIGGGMPIGVVTGSARFMDSVDGGQWTDDGDGYPQVDKIWFAGTFNKNPMTMATTEAVVERFEREGPRLQEGLNDRAEQLTNRLTAWLEANRMPVRIARFGSMFRFLGPVATTLLIPHLIMRGCYTWEGMVFFVSVAHSDADLDTFESAVKDSLLTMRRGGYLD
jgi:glutamate-1-semialdehyde aminotransferase